MKFEAVQYAGLWFVVRWDKPDEGTRVHGPCPREEAEELALRWNAPSAFDPRLEVARLVRLRDEARALADAAYGQGDWLAGAGLIHYANQCQAKADRCEAEIQPEAPAGSFPLTDPSVEE